MAISGATQLATESFNMVRTAVKHASLEKLTTPLNVRKLSLYIFTFQKLATIVEWLEDLISELA